VSYDPCYHQACDSMDPIGDGADADLYEAINESTTARSSGTA
jgi:hypothetical protein